MDPIIIFYNLIREAGQLAPLLVLYVGWRLMKNDLKHLVIDVKFVKDELVKHLAWHAEKK